jgi:hypothetical protein
VTFSADENNVLLAKNCDICAIEALCPLDHVRAGQRPKTGSWRKLGSVGRCRLRLVVFFALPPPLTIVKKKWPTRVNEGTAFGLDCPEHRQGGGMRMLAVSFSLPWFYYQEISLWQYRVHILTTYLLVSTVWSGCLRLFSCQVWQNSSSGRAPMTINNHGLHLPVEQGRAQNQFVVLLLGGGGLHGLVTALNFYFALWSYV